jgi:hypothetical protein
LRFPAAVRARARVRHRQQGGNKLLPAEKEPDFGPELRVFAPERQQPLGEDDVAPARCSVMNSVESSSAI